MELYAHIRPSPPSSQEKKFGKPRKGCEDVFFHHYKRNSSEQAALSSKDGELRHVRELHLLLARNLSLSTRHPGYAYRAEEDQN